MNERPATAVQTLTCAGCGSAIPLAGLQPQVRCPYCQHDQLIPPDKLAQLAAYERSASAILQRIDGEREQKALWDVWYGPDGKARHPWAGLLIVALPMVVLTVGGVVLLQAGLISQQTQGILQTVTVVGVYVLGFGGYLAFKSARRKRDPAAHAQVRAQCPRCGAPQAFEAGRAVERCEHCGASLVANAAVMQQGILEASEDLRREAMARVRLERNAMTRVYAMSAASSTAYIIFGSFLPITAGGAIAFTVENLLSDKTQTPPAGIALLWAVASANLAIPLMIYQLRKKRRLQWRTLADGIASRIDGTVTTAKTEWVAWLNSLWAGPYAITNLMTGTYFHAVTGRIGAYAVAVDLDPIPADGEHQHARADVLLAAWLQTLRTVPTCHRILRRNSRRSGSLRRQARQACLLPALASSNSSGSATWTAIRLCPPQGCSSSGQREWELRRLPPCREIRRHPVASISS